MNLPNASQSFKTLNPRLFGHPKAKNDVQAILERSSTLSARMNKTEREYALILEAMKQRDEILRWEYQGMTLRWFDMKYTPDFVVFGAPYTTTEFRTLDGQCSGREIKRFPITMIEVKGLHIHYRQQAVARFKGARGFWPEFSFEMHQKTKDGWKRIY